MTESKSTAPHKHSQFYASLTLKLLVAFLLVAVVASSIVAVLSNQSATVEFTRFVRENQIEPPDELVAQLAHHYAIQGDWTGSEQLLNQAYSSPDGPGPAPVLLLVDGQGQIIASNWKPLFGGRVREHELAAGYAVTIGNEVVGTLVMPGPRPPALYVERGLLTPRGLATVDRVRRTITLASVGAGAAALVIAGVLTWGLVRPLRRLTAAAEGIARGDLSQRVPVTGNDEVAELTDTFNHMAAELERAEQLRRNMTADVAHELRTPLTVVRGKLEGVLDGIYPPTPEHLQPILEATDLLIFLVEDLRMLAQAEAGRLTLSRQAIGIGDLLREARETFDVQASSREITLALDVAPDLPPVMADSHRIIQVLANLIINALRHTPAGGRVTLEAASNGSMARVVVSDTGSGIPPEDLPYVFDRFWRGDRSRSRLSGGGGLGLAIVRQLVELHGGTAGAQSQPGQGSSFWFTLPFA